MWMRSCVKFLFRRSKIEERSRTLLKSWLVRHIGVFAEPGDLKGLFVEVVMSVE
jgi:hypothetical protein